MRYYWQTIKEKMNFLGITSWYQLSKLSGISESTLSNTRNRNGYLSFENTCKIANALDISLDSLNEWKK